MLAENQIYRIDHYLGKETVQNIMVFRFANGIFEPIWNRDHIDHVQITVAESVGVEGRGDFYDATGALRDMVPNHLFQLLTLSGDGAADLFRRRRSADREGEGARRDAPASRGRGAGATWCAASTAPGTIDGRHDRRLIASEPTSRPIRATETFVALKLMIDNWRWADVPFYLRTGKRLPRRATEIAIQFKQAPYALFRDTPVDTSAPN